MLLNCCCISPLQNIRNAYNPCTQGANRFFNKLKNEIQNSILRFCFNFNKEDEIQITDYHFHV